MDGIIKLVVYSKWVILIVLVIKKNGSVWLCGDYKVIVNLVMCVDKYFFFKIEDIFVIFVGGKKFLKFDLM